jgi:hypothetical protein
MAAYLANMRLCSVTGNVLVSRGRQGEEGGSLFVDAEPWDDKRYRVAVTGNVLVGKSRVPPRPGVPAPMNDWLRFNAT